MALSIEFTEEQIQEKLIEVRDELLNKDNYSSVLKKSLERLIGNSWSSGSISESFDKIVEEQILKMVQTEEFATILGKTVADVLAKRVIDSKYLAKPSK